MSRHPRQSTDTLLLGLSSLATVFHGSVAQQQAHGLLVCRTHNTFVFWTGVEPIDERFPTAHLQAELQQLGENKGTIQVHDVCLSWSRLELILDGCLACQFLLDSSIDEVVAILPGCEDGETTLSSIVPAHLLVDPVKNEQPIRIHLLCVYVQRRVRSCS